MTDPHIADARTAAAAVRVALVDLDAAIRGEAGGAHPGRRPPPALTAAARRRTAELVRAERAERAEQARAGSLPGTPGRAPVRAALLDAQAACASAAVDCAWVAASALRRRPLVVFGGAWVIALGVDESRAALRYLLVVLDLVPPAVAAEVAGVLDRAAGMAHAALGTGRVRTPVPGRACPVCCRRSLVADVTSPAERDWTVRCGCACRGPGCPCGAGPAHVWTVEGFGRAWGDLDRVFAVIRSVRRQMVKRDRGAMR